MPWKYSSESYRDYTRTTWDAAVDGFVRLLPQYAPITAELVESLDLRPGERVLDLGTGPGEPALSLADVVGKTGEVVGVDLSPKMIDAARAAAADRAIDNVRFEVADAEHLPFPDGTFDAVVSRYGFQIFTEPEACAREAHRVLAPGGRLGLAVWAGAAAAPVLDVLVGPMLAHAEPDEDGYLPSPYELARPGELASLLQLAGFRSVTERRVDHPWTFPSADAYLEAILRGTPIGHSLDEEDAQVRRTVLAETRANLARYRVGDRLVLGAGTIVAVAWR